MSRTSSKWQIILLVEISLLIFFSGLLPAGWIEPAITLIFTAIYITCARMARQWKNGIIPVAGLLVLLRITTNVLGFDSLAMLISLLNFFFFIAIVAMFVIRIARSQNVTSTVILEAVNGYLLSGILFAALIMLIAGLSPNAFTDQNDHVASTSHDFIYFSFVTLTTLGYGDMLPVTSYAKSVAILISVYGQLYLTVIIALLVGKYSSRTVS